MTAPNRSWLSVEQVADIVAVSKMTIYRLADSGELTAYRIGRSIRIPPADLDRYLLAARMGRP